MNRPLCAALLLATASAAAIAQTPPRDSPVFKSPQAATCPECGVVRSLKRVEAAAPLTPREREATAGYVASVPLGGGKPTTGSVTDVRNERKPPAVSWEVVVRLDDGRLQLVRQDDAANLREGDKVRIDRGKVVLRDK